MGSNFPLQTTINAFFKFTFFSYRFNLHLFFQRPRAFFHRHRSIYKLINISLLNDPPGVFPNSCKSSKGIVNATGPAVLFFDWWRGRYTKSLLLSHPIFTLINANARELRFAFLKKQWKKKRGTRWSESVMSEFHVCFRRFAIVWF